MKDTTVRPDLETIFHEYKDFVYRICYRYFRNARDAEDISQDVFVKLHHRLPGFRGDAKLTTWIYRVSVNSCIDALRSRKENTRLEDLEPDKLIALNVCGHGDASLARIDLDRILSQTDAKMRELLFLTLVEGCTNEEAGEVVGLTKWAVSKAVIRFQKKILARKKAWFSELFDPRPGEKTLVRPAAEKTPSAREAA